MASGLISGAAYGTGLSSQLRIQDEIKQLRKKTKLAEQAIILFNNEKVKETVAYLIRVGIIRSQMRLMGESTLKNQMDSNNFYLTNISRIGETPVLHLIYATNTAINRKKRYWVFIP